MDHEMTTNLAEAPLNTDLVRKKAWARTLLNLETLAKEINEDPGSRVLVLMAGGLPGQFSSSKPFYYTLSLIGDTWVVRGMGSDYYWGQKSLKLEEFLIAQYPPSLQKGAATVFSILARMLLVPNYDAVEALGSPPTHSDLLDVSKSFAVLTERVEPFPPARKRK